MPAREHVHAERARTRLPVLIMHGSEAKSAADSQTEQPQGELGRLAPATLLTALDTLDEVLAQHADALGQDLTPYRHHAYRVINFCAALSSHTSTHAPEQLEKLQVAVAFHDLGLWTARTFDYLAPSLALARAHLRARQRDAWIPEIEAMILEHHKLRAYRSNPEWLVEPFRRADWIDVSYGARSFGLPRALLREVFARFPDQGFHRRLVQFALAHARSNPTRPLPMVRW